MMKIFSIFQWIKQPGDNLSERLIHGGVLVFFQRLTNQGLALIKTVVLARLLSPRDFGLFGIALLIISTLRYFSRTGFENALIHKDQDVEPYLDTAWTINLIKGTALAVILALGAPEVGIFFEESRAVLLVRILGISILIENVKNIGIIYFQKEIEFNKQFIYQFMGNVVELIVAVTAAILLQDVWALVYGLLAGHLTRSFFSYLLHDYRPRLRLDWTKAGELFDYGRWIMGSSVLVFIINQGDDFFLGKLLGAAALGLYQLAYKISNLPATEITNVVSQVSFPAYAKLQDQPAKLARMYLQVLRMTVFVSVPVAVGIAFLASDFTNLFLGEDWLAMVPAMQVLSIWGLIRSIGATTGPLFQAIGRPDLSTKLQGLKAVLLAVLIYPLTIKWGIVGTASAVVINALIVNPLANYLVINTLDCSILEYIKNIIYPLVGACIMFLILMIVKTYFVSGINILSFILLVGLGILSYFGVMIVIEKLSDYQVSSTIRDAVAFAISK